MTTRTETTSFLSAFLLRHGAILVVAGLVALGWAIYGNSLQCGFHFDDFPNILENRAIQIPSLSGENLRKAAFDSPLHRPVAYLSFALNYRAGGLEPQGYHVVNILVHILAGLGLFAATLLVLDLPALKPRYGEHRVVVAGLAAFLWLSHPVQVQAVTYIVQRMIGLATMFGIWSVVAALWGSQRQGWRRYAAWGGGLFLWTLALGSKETAIVLPTVVVLCFPLLRASKVKAGSYFVTLAVAAVVGVTAVGFIWGPVNALRSIRSLFGGDAGQLLTVPRAFFYSLSLLLLPLPSRLSFEHDLYFSRTLIDPVSTVVALGGMLAVFGSVPLLVRRKPLIVACAVWFLVPFVLETVHVRRNPVFEHRLYLPSMGLAVMVAVPLTKLVKGRFRVLASLGAGLLVAVLSFVSWERNMVWQNEMTLGLDAVAKAPGKARAYATAIYGLVQGGDRERAAVYYQRLLGLSPRDPREFHWRGTAAMTMGDYGTAVDSFTRALVMDPRLCEPRESLAEAYIKRGNVGAALGELQVFEKVCTDTIVRPSAKENSRRLMEMAESSMVERVQSSPDDLQARMALAGILLHRKKPAEAMRHLTVIVDRGGGTPEVLSNLGFAYLDMGDGEAALRTFEGAARQAPEFSSVYYGMARALEMLGRPVDAGKRYRRYLSLAPRHEAFRVVAEERLRLLETGQ